MARFFKVEARTILSLGRESIKEATTALVELVKNSYDADAERVIIEINTQQSPTIIRIRDNGIGMDEREVESKWLRIGYSEKNEEQNKISPKGRRRTGEKGVGRISADRLGKHLELVTKKSRKIFGLRVNWSSFEERGKSLDEIELYDIENPEIDLPPMLNGDAAASGLCLTIKELRDVWTAQDVEDLRREFSLLISPFSSLKDFQISTTSDIEDAENGLVVSEMNRQAVISLDARYKSGKQNVRYALKVIGERKPSNYRIPLNQLLNVKATDDHPSLNCGDTLIRLLFFVKGQSIFGEISLDRKAISSFVDRNAGIKIYRDDVWVKPYGEINKEEWDWLNLGRRFGKNPAGAGRPTFRIRPQQLVGAVFVERDQNPTLTDSAGREGLIKGSGFEDLKKLTEGCIRLIESEYHRRFLGEKREKAKKIYNEIKTLTNDATAIVRDMQSIAPMVAHSTLDLRSKERFENSLGRVKDISTSLKEFSKAVRSVEQENVLFRGLATIGISMSVFGHEIQSSINNILSIAYKLQDYVAADPPKINLAVEKIQRLIEISDSVSHWGKYALNRIRREKRQRRTHNLVDTVHQVVSDLLPPFDSANIEIKTRLEKVEGKAFVMDVEAILINLLTNAYNACQQKKTRRRIRIELKKSHIDEQSAFEIIVADSGPGVSKRFQEQIWEPLFTTKAEGQRNAGTGLGLAIIDSIVQDSGGVRSVDVDSSLKGARFSIRLPLPD